MLVWCEDLLPGQVIEFPYSGKRAGVAPWRGRVTRLLIRDGVEMMIVYIDPSPKPGRASNYPSTGMLYFRPGTPVDVVG